MMKAYINIKNNSNLHTHQTLNKSIWLMKRESGRSPIHHFSFGERFDEKMLRVHPSGGQCCYVIHSSFHQIFTPHQVQRESNRGEHRHPQAGRTDFHPADRQGKADVTSEKRTAFENRRHRRRLLENKKP
jgi:hypothetical protein